MADRPRFFDDLAGVAGGAMSALMGVREEFDSVVKARMEDAIRHFDLAKREELDAAMQLAANARAGQELAEAKLAALEARVAALEAAAEPRVRPAVAGGGPGMVA